MACGLCAKCMHFIVREYAGGLLGGIENAIDKRVACGNTMALQPEEDIGFAAHRANLDDLIEAKKMRRDAAIYRIGERGRMLVGLNDRGGVHAGGSAEGVAPDHGIIRR